MGSGLECGNAFECWYGTQTGQGPKFIEENFKKIWCCPISAKCSRLWEPSTQTLTLGCLFGNPADVEAKLTFMVEDGKGGYINRKTPGCNTIKKDSTISSTLGNFGKKGDVRCICGG